MRRSWIAGLVLALAAVGVGYAEVKVNDLLSVQAKGGSALRREPAALSPSVATLPYGTRAQVLELRGAWARVHTLSGDGWMRTTDLVAPATLTGGGATGPSAGGGQPTAGVSAADVSAAGRQFDEPTEQGYRRDNPNLQPAFGLVDQMEKTKPTPAEVEEFIRQGRLGR